MINLELRVFPKTIEDVDNLLDVLYQKRAEDIECYKISDDFNEYEAELFDEP